MTQPAGAAHRMRGSRRVVDALLEASRVHAAHGDHAAAVALFGGAATLSRRRHTGVFTNPMLESQVRAVGEALAGSWGLPRAPSVRRDLGSPPTRLLHVMTRAYGAGGHSRLVERWIDGDARAISSVVLTQGRDSDTPPTLTAAVERSGGSVHVLRGAAVERARRLHALAAAADALVLSIHENDVVPLVALAGLSRRAPVLVINHAEHVFWAGASLADVLVSLRPASIDLATRRRGIQRHRCVEVPLPVSTRTRRSSPEDARRALGIEPAHKVLLTVGWGYKFTRYRGDDLITALGPILDEADVHLVAVGPREDEPLWSSARARYGGRVHAAGRQDDVQGYFDAADVVVDSYPIASLTAALDAGTAGVPFVGLAPCDAGWPRVLREDDPALVAAICDDVGDFRRRITSLLRDPSAWRSTSYMQRESVVRTHGAQAWSQAMQRVHEAAAAGVRGIEQRRGRDHLGTPGAEDDILATYIADCEDRFVRPEMRCSPGEPDAAGAEAGLVNDGLRRIDELLTRAGSPTRADYERALEVAHSLTPRSVLMPRFDAGRRRWAAGVARRVRALRR